VEPHVPSRTEIWKGTKSGKKRERLEKKQGQTSLKNGIKKAPKKNGRGACRRKAAMEGGHFVTEEGAKNPERRVVWGEKGNEKGGDIKSRIQEGFKVAKRGGIVEKKNRGIPARSPVFAGPLPNGGGDGKVQTDKGRKKIVRLPGTERCRKKSIYREPKDQARKGNLRKVGGWGEKGWGRGPANACAKKFSKRGAPKKVGKETLQLWGDVCKNIGGKVQENLTTGTKKDKKDLSRIVRRITERLEKESTHRAAGSGVRYWSRATGGEGF